VDAENQSRLSEECTFEDGLAHHRAGRLTSAAQCYQQIVNRSPDNADAVHGLGVIAYQLGRFDEAVVQFRRAVALRPTSGSFQSNLGLACMALNLPDEGVAALMRASELSPDIPNILFNLANALRSRGRLGDAIAIYNRVLALSPDHAEACNNQANCLRDVGRLEDANDGYRRAVRLRPDYAEAWNNWANCLRDQGKAAEAEACCRNAIRIKPDFALAYNNLGNALKYQDRHEDAVASYRAALALDPDCGVAHENLGQVLFSLGQIGAALDSFRKAAELEPDRPEPLCSLGNVLMYTGSYPEGNEHYLRALKLRPEDAAARSAWLHWRQYQPDVTPASLAADLATWDRSCGGNTRTDSEPDRPRLIDRWPPRLGCVSADFGRHPVAFFSVGVLEALARENFEIVCYSNCLRHDEVTARFKSLATQWREVRCFPDVALCGRIRADGIDVLLDLNGHSAGNRLSVFARKPAPVQISWIGSEGSTGLSAMDYVLADDHVVPAGAEKHYRERVLRLPEVYVCYDTPADAPAVSPPPSLKNGFVTFGSFNNPAKLNDRVVGAWSAIMNEIPNSRLLLKYRGITDAAVREPISDRFARRGIRKERISFSGWSPRREMFEEYRSVDVALDPFPFCGGATTCEALWMGLPVVTCPGLTFAGRHSLSYLSAIGMTESVAVDPDDYVRVAVRLGRDVDNLGAIRVRLRERMVSSPLCDANRLAVQIKETLRTVIYEARRS
jgi:predicted O-linked N-acetylglucosamine transferase (SPINDLY family)